MCRNMGLVCVFPGLDCELGVISTHSCRECQFLRSNVKVMPNHALQCNKRIVKLGVFPYEEEVWDLGGDAV